MKTKIYCQYCNMEIIYPNFWYGLIPPEPIELCYCSILKNQLDKNKEKWYNLIIL